MQWDLLAAMLACAAGGVALWNLCFRPRLPWRWAAVLAALALGPLLPALRPGMVYGPFDTNASKLPWASSTAELGARAESPGLNDVTLQLVPWQTEARRQLLAGRVPLLNPYSGAGQPLLGNGQSAPFSAVSLLALPFDPRRAQSLRAFLKVLLALAGTYLAARQLGCRSWFALPAAAAYGYGGSLTVWQLFPHAEVMALWPFAFLASERLLAAPAERRARALLVLALAGMLLAGHPETAAAAGLALAGRWLYVLLRHRRDPLRRRAVGTLVAGAALALLLTAFFTLPLAQTILGSEKLARAGAGGAEVAPATARAASLGAFLNQVAPGAFRGASTLHWLVEGTVGLPALLLAVAGLLAGTWRRPPGGYLALLAAVAYALHLDPGVLWALLRGIPLLAAFAPRYLAYLGGFAVALLAALALERWAAPRADSRALAPAAGIAVALLTLAQLRLAFAGYVPTVPAAVAYPEVPLLARLAREPGPFRLIGTRGVLPPNASTVYGLHDVRSHDPTESARLVAWQRARLDLDTRRYHKHYLGPRPEHLPALRRLGVRFLLAGPRLRPGPPWLDRGRFGATRLWELLGEVRWAAFQAPSRRAQVLETKVDGGRIDVRVAVREPAWLVVAQAAVPGWRAEADGRPLPTGAADGALLAVRVPAGARRVRLRYAPAAWRLGAAISLLGLVGAAAYARLHR
jgi:Bacterial membrane protein YfhO